MQSVATITFDLILLVKKGITHGYMFPRIILLTWNEVLKRNVKF